MRRIRGLAAILIAAIAFAAPVLAVTTAFWRLSTQAEFEKGKIVHTAIASSGALSLGPAYEQVPGVAVPYVWSLAQDSAFNIFAGSGDKGVIYKITGKLQAGEFCKLPEQHVLSLAFDKAGSLLAGTAPHGVVYKITPSGQATVFAQTKESYVWALAWSPDGLTLYAATGPHGKIFKIPAAGGEPTVLLDSGQNHILCLAVDKEGNVYGGSEPGGLVYKVTPAGKAFVIYDASEGDVHSLAFDATGNLYAATAAAGEIGAAMGGRMMGGVTVMPEGIAPAQPPMGERAPAGQQPTARRPMPAGMPAFPEMPSPAPPPPTVSVKNSIYKIAPDGRVTQALVLDRTMILCLAVVGDDLWAGTGNDSKLYRISLSDPTRYELVMDPEELQVIRLLPLAPNSPQGALAIATGNTGHVYAMKGSFAQKGTFLSSVFDTSTISQWGAVSWEGDVPPGASISVATRTGNSERPDKTWSDWSRESSSSGGERIQSPPSRFIQIRATLASSAPEKTPRIREIKVPYLAFNMPPVVTKLTLDGATGEASESEKQASSSTSGGTMAEKIMKMVSKTSGATTTKAAAPAAGAIPAHKVERTVSWEAKDPDGDKLEYKLTYRGVGEKEWKLLKDELTTTTYTWDTETVPDGEYELRIVASDSPANPPDKAQTAEKISEPILIDNTRPTVESLKATPAGDGQWKIRGKAIDAVSIIVEIQYSVDSKDWVAVDPLNGIFDSKTAEFEFAVKKLDKGEHTVAVKATDAAGNRGVGKVVFH